MGMSLYGTGKSLHRISVESTCNRNENGLSMSHIYIYFSYFT